MPLTSYLAGSKCVYYAWEVEEHWSRTVTETYRDAKGNMQTRTRTESGWKRIADGSESGPFYLKDATGIIRIVPEGTKRQGKVIFNQTVRRYNPLYYGKGPATSIANSTHQRRFLETILPLHAELYVIGQAHQREDIAAAEIVHDKATPLFIISIRSEKQISPGYGRWLRLWFILGLLTALGGGTAWVVLTSMNSAISGIPILIMGAVYLCLLLLIWLWTTYNNLIGLHHRVEQDWSQVEIQLKRRRDLIPNLLATTGNMKARRRPYWPGCADKWRPHHPQ